MTKEELVKIIEPVINEGEPGWANPYDQEYGLWLAQKVAYVLMGKKVKVYRASDGTWYWDCGCSSAEQARKETSISKRWCIDSQHDTWQSAMNCADYHRRRECTRSSD